MTKITTYNRGIIIDGHADTKEECETITLLCNSLAKDKNFKQVAYDDGYAAFERVGKAERLRFAPGPGSLSIYDTATGDEVLFINSDTTVTVTYSGKIITFNINGGGMSISRVNSNYVETYDSGVATSLTATMKNTISSLVAKGDGSSNYDITFAASSKLSVDLTALSGWANLTPGNHTIKIVAKGTGYRDSEKSAGVEVTKAAEVYTDCLTFTGESSEFTLKATNKKWDGTLQWSTDHNTWTTLNGTEAMQSVNKKLYLRGKGNTAFCDRNFVGVYWKLSAKADCSGNIQTLLDWENPSTSISTANCYRGLFKECTNLTSAPELPATTLADGCYAYMFIGCTNLTSAPFLPATTLIDNCYLQMFNNCTKLKVNTTSGNKIFTCPSDIPSFAVSSMFSSTGGSFTGTPTAGNTYYWTE